MGRNPARNQLQREEARRRILDAAVSAFGERGIATASMAEIARRAGVSKGLCYHYFPSKDDLVAAVVQRRVDHVLALARSVPDALRGRERLSAVVQALVDDVRTDPSGFRLLLRALAAPDADRTVGRVLPRIERPAEGGLFSAFGMSGDPEEARFFRICLLGLLTHLALSPIPSEPDALVSRLMDLIPEEP